MGQSRHLSMQMMNQDFVHRCIQITHDQVMMPASELRGVDEQRSTTNGARGFGILPSVADDK
jgi:hypothetical protein